MQMPLYKGRLLPTGFCRVLRDLSVMDGSSTQPKEEKLTHMDLISKSSAKGGMHLVTGCTQRLSRLVY